MERRKIGIAELGEFQFTDELLGLAMKRTRADLYREVSDRGVRGRASLNKEQLAVVLVDVYLREQDDAENERNIVENEKHAQQNSLAADTPLAEGDVLVDPQSRSGQQYRFVKMSPCGPLLVNLSNGGRRVVAPHLIKTWGRLNQVTPAGEDDLPRVGDVVKHRIGDDRERVVTRVHGTDPYVLLNDHGNVWVAMAHLVVVRRADEPEQPVEDGFFGGRDLGTPSFGYVRAEAVRTATQQFLKDTLAGREAAETSLQKHRAAFAYTASRLRSLAEDIELFVKENR